jgi:hypothetical protein
VGNLLSIKRVAPQDAAAPIAPPTIAFPTKIVPPSYKWSNLNIWCKRERNLRNHIIYTKYIFFLRINEYLLIIL